MVLSTCHLKLFVHQIQSESISCMSPKPVSSIPIISIILFTVVVTSRLAFALFCFSQRPVSKSIPSQSIVAFLCLKRPRMTSWSLLSKFCLLVSSSDLAITGITPLDSQQGKRIFTQNNKGLLNMNRHGPSQHEWMDRVFST